MDGKGTSLAVGIMGLEVALALLLIYIAWARTDIQDHMLGAALGALLLAAVLFIQLFFFKYPENRRPIVFFLVFIGLLLLPGIVFLIAQATTGFRMNLVNLDGPGAPSPLIYLLPYILVFALVFIRMATWAMTFEPKPGSHAISPEDLRRRMLLMNEAGFPFTIKPGKRADELIMNWKYANAAWFDLMRLHKVSSLSTFVIRLNGADRTVRVREHKSEFDASAGLGGLSLSYNGQWGAISFYEVRRETLYGVQIENGRPVAKLSYTYKFDIREMRGPLRMLVVENGWTFKSVTIFAKWLTG